MNVKYKVKRLVYRNPLLKNAYEYVILPIRVRTWQTKLKENGWITLKNISIILSRYGFKYFLDSGTLLGIVRDGNFIPHDTDIDLGIIYDSCFQVNKLDDVLESIGFKRQRAFYFREKPAVLTYSDKSLAVDFFVYFPTADPARWKQYCFNRSVWKDYPNDAAFDVYEADCPITGIKCITAKNLQLNVPQNAEEYLSSIYTENWKIPTSNWNFLDSPRLHLLENEYGILR